MHAIALVKMKQIKERIKPLLVILMLLGCPAAVFGAGDNPWERWLDNAYQLTWHDPQDIDRWITANEARTFTRELAAFAAEWDRRLAPVKEEGDFSPYPARVYRHLAIAHTLLYLRSMNAAHLEKALAITEREIVKSKIDLPEMAFWYHYIHALYSLARADSSGFVAHVYRIWFDVVLKLEAARFQFGPSFLSSNLKGYYKSIPFLYRNLANLILRRAIVQSRMPGVDSLGVIVLNLSHRMPAEGYGKWIAHVAGRLQGPESDNFRLTFTVLYLEAEKYRQAVEDLIDAATDPAMIEKNLVSLLEQYEVLYRLARTGHGKAAATTRYLSLISFVTSRLYEKGPRRILLSAIPLLRPENGKAWHESRDIVSRGIKLFYALTTTRVRETDWHRSGFVKRETYVAAMHDLWRAIMYTCIDTGIYYERFLDTRNMRALTLYLPLVRKILETYLAMFDHYAVKGDLDIIPDNAYFGAAEVAERLSEIHFQVAAWSKGTQQYNLSLIRRLQAAEIFPFDTRSYYLLARRLADLGRLEVYKQSLFMLAFRVHNSKVLAEMAGSRETYMGINLAALQQVIPKIIMHAPDNIVLQDGLNSIPGAISNRIDMIAGELASKSGKLKMQPGDLERIDRFAQTIQGRLGQAGFAPKEIGRILQELAQVNRLLEDISKPESVLFPGRHSALNPSGGVVFTKFFHQFQSDLKKIEEEGAILVKLSEMKEMRDTMVLEAEHPFHGLLRRLFHEYPHEYLNYLRLLKGKHPFVPYSWDSLEKPHAKVDRSRLQRLTTNQMDRE